MGKQRDRGSVAVDVDLLSYLMRRSGLNKTTLANKAKVSTATLRRAASGQPLDITTVHILAEHLGTVYERLALLEGSPTPTEAEMPKTRKRTKAKQTGVRRIGESEDYDFLAQCKVYYDMSRATSDNTWGEMDEVQRLQFCVKCLTIFVVDTEMHRPLDWPLIKGKSEFDSTDFSARTAFAFAEEQVKQMETGKFEKRRYNELWRLMRYSRNVDVLNQVKRLLGEAMRRAKAAG